MKRLNKKGVSLAELLAVVVIMGIIAAIAIPLVGNVIKTSEKKAYLGDLTTLVEAARTYCIAEGDNALCDKYGYISDGVTGNATNNNFYIDVNGDIVVGTGEETPADAIEAKATSLTVTAGDPANVLEKYLSKPLTKIGSTINIITDGNKYWVATEGTKSNSKYDTAGKFVDPTDSENAMKLFVENVA